MKKKTCTQKTGSIVIDECMNHWIKLRLKISQSNKMVWVSSVLDTNQSTVVHFNKIKLLTVGESKFRCGKSKLWIFTNPIESWLDRLRTIISGVSEFSNATVCESEISKPRRHRVSASITSSVARSAIEMAILCSTSLQSQNKNKRNNQYRY